MAQPVAPTSPRGSLPFVHRDGTLTPQGLLFLEQMWRQVAAGFVIVPVVVAGTNELTLTPTLAAQGAASYGTGMAWFGTAAETSTGAVTATVTDGRNALATVKVYAGNGTAQANAGDLMQDASYLFIYRADLDGGAGGLVLK